MSRSIKLVFLACLLCVASLTVFAAPSTAAPGDPDVSFNGTGTLKFNSGEGDRGSRAAIQSTGKIVVATGTINTVGGSIVVRRLNVDGTFDLTFGTAGQTTIDFTGVAANTDEFHSLEIVSGDKILLSGNVAGNPVKTAIARLTADGSPDTAVGFTNGKSVIGACPTLDTFAEGATEDASGRTLILSYGALTSVHKFVARLQPNGVADLTFGGSCVPTYANYYDTPTGTWGFSTSSMLVDLGGGQTAFSGNANTGGVARMALAKLNGSALDASFDGDGFAFGPANSASSSGVLLPDGKIVLAGYIRDPAAPSVHRMLIIRFLADGQIDPTFGNGGSTEINLGPSSELDAIALDPIGRLIAAGRVLDGANTHVVAIRTLLDGTLDTGFGDGGVKALPFADPEMLITKVRVDSSGRYLYSAYIDVGGAAPSASFVGRTLGGITPPATGPDAATFKLKLKSPSKKKLKAKKFTKISGTASSNYPLSKLEVAIQRIDKTALKKKKRCLWVRSSKGAIKKVKAKNKKCSAPVWLKATGTTSWSYKLKKALKTGSYSLKIRATGSTGATSQITTRSLKLN